MIALGVSVPVGVGSLILFFAQWEVVVDGPYEMDAITQVGAPLTTACLGLGLMAIWVAASGVVALALGSKKANVVGRRIREWRTWAIDGRVAPQAFGDAVRSAGRSWHGEMERLTRNQRRRDQAAVAVSALATAIPSAILGTLWGIVRVTWGGERHPIFGNMYLGLTAATIILTVVAAIRAFALRLKNGSHLNSDLTRLEIELLAGGPSKSAGPSFLANAPGGR